MKQPFVSEATFRAALTSGDEQLLVALLNRLFKPITAFLEASGAAPAEAEEIFYIGMEVLWERGRRSGYEPNFNFYAYLLQTCKQQWYNELRRRKNWEHAVTAADADILNLDPSIQELLEMVEFHNLLFHNLDRLGNPCRQLLLLWADGHSFGEISKKMGYKDASSARQQKHKCLERLKKTM